MLIHPSCFSESKKRSYSESPSDSYFPSLVNDVENASPSIRAIIGYSPSKKSVQWILTVSPLRVTTFLDGFLRYSSKLNCFILNPPTQLLLLPHNNRQICLPFRHLLGNHIIPHQNLLLLGPDIY